MISIVIRTLNEELYLDELLAMVGRQEVERLPIETVIIDSGSTDRTLDIAKRHGCRITHIERSDFTFGRSLNRGSEFAKGDILVYVSGHCIPEDEFWLANLTGPLISGDAQYAYGRQIGGSATKFSEKKLFDKYYPEKSRIPQTGFFCNNANSAINRSTWRQYKFDEEVTGLEDMDLAKRLVGDGGAIAYIAEAAVFHIHHEHWGETKRRYEREAIALQKIMPEVHVSFFDMVRYLSASIFSDMADALFERRWCRESIGIVKFRSAQYWGIFRGNHEHRKLSRERKEDYFYPKRVIRKTGK